MGRGTTKEQGTISNLRDAMVAESIFAASGPRPPLSSTFDSINMEHLPSLPHGASWEVQRSPPS